MLVYGTVLFSFKKTALCLWWVCDSNFGMAIAYMKEDVLKSQKIDAW